MARIAFNTPDSFISQCTLERAGMLRGASPALGEDVRAPAGRAGHLRQDCLQRERVRKTGRAGASAPAPLKCDR
eukprot:610614-Prorocentrum_minimum.AAC.1